MNQRVEKFEKSAARTGGGSASADGQGRYIEDTMPQGCGPCFRSPVAHGEITTLNVDDARGGWCSSGDHAADLAEAGIEAHWTVVATTSTGGAARAPRAGGPSCAHVGEPVAVVIAETMNRPVMRLR